MKFTLLCILLATSNLISSDSAPKPISEADLKNLEIISLRLELMETKSKLLEFYRNDVIRVICQGAKIDLKECVVDPSKQTVTKKKPEPEK